MPEDAANDARTRHCGVCGRTPTDEAEALAWTFDAGGGRESWFCPTCSRDNVRSIEAKLEQEWW